VKDPIYGDTKECRSEYTSLSDTRCRGEPGG